MRAQLGWRFATYGEFARVQCRTVLTYRADLFFRIIVLLLQVFLLRVVWTAVYSSRDAVEGSGVGAVGLSTQIAYATLATLQFWLFDGTRSRLVLRIYEGKVAVDLSRPLGLVQQSAAASVGASIALLPFVALALPFAILLGGAEAPASPAALIGYVVAMVGAYAIIVLLNLLTDMIAFWTLEATGPLMILRLVTQVMSGALVPLWFMPDWLRTVAQLLPFQATTYTPVAVYLGRPGPGGLTAALGVQLVWIVVLGLALRVVWSRAVHRVVAQGG